MKTSIRHRTKEEEKNYIKLSIKLFKMNPRMTFHDWVHGKIKEEVE